MAQAWSARRIIVLGCAGTGKTTFARRLGERIGAPHLCLDDIWGGELRPADFPVFRALMRKYVDNSIGHRTPFGMYANEPSVNTAEFSVAK